MYGQAFKYIYCLGPKTSFCLGTLEVFAKNLLQTLNHFPE